MLTEKEELELLELENENAASSASISQPSPENPIAKAGKDWYQSTQQSVQDVHEAPTLPEKGLRLIGGASKAAIGGLMLPVTAAVNASPTLQAGAKFIGEKVANTPGVKQGIEAYSDWRGKLSPRAQKNVGAVESMAGVAPVGKAVGLAGEVAGKTAKEGVKLAGEAVGTVTYPAAKALDNIAGKLSSEFTGVPEEALRKSTTKAGRTEVKSMAKKQNDVGQHVVSLLEKPMDYLPEWPQVEGVLKRLPPMETAPIIDFVEGLKVPDAVGTAAKKANEYLTTIQNDLMSLKGIKGTGGAPVISADRLYKIRQQIDKDIDWGDVEKSVSNEKLTEVRRLFKDYLVDFSAKNGAPEYESLMRSFSDKLNKIDKAQDYFGSNIGTRKDRAASVISNLFNKNRDERLKAIENIQEIFGEDFVRQAKLVQLADQIGEGGEASWLPRHTTGRSLLGMAGASTIGTPALGVALSSPKIATRVTLPATQGILNATRKLKQ